MVVVVMGGGGVTTPSSSLLKNMKNKSNVCVWVCVFVSFSPIMHSHRSPLVYMHLSYWLADLAFQRVRGGWMATYATIHLGCGPHCTFALDPAVPFQAEGMLHITQEKFTFCLCQKETSAKEHDFIINMATDIMLGILYYIILFLVILRL